jgi:hypothetical protein
VVDALQGQAVRGVGHALIYQTVCLSASTLALRPTRRVRFTVI